MGVFEDVMAERSMRQGALIGTERKYNYETRQHETVLGRQWNASEDSPPGNPLDYSVRNDPKPKPAPEIGSSSARKLTPPAAPPGQQKQKTGYGEGPGFPRNSQNGYQQGTLFAHEAPARDQNTRQHIGYSTPLQRSHLQGTPMTPDDAYDTRMAKGSLTGHFDPNAPLYHGTKKELKGDEIVPGKYKAGDQIGQKKGLAKDGRRLNAYATGDKELAEGYTKTAKGKLGKTPKVYEVKPTGPVSADMEYMHGAGEPHSVSESIKNSTEKWPTGLARYPIAVKSPKPMKVVREISADRLRGGDL